MRSWVVMSVVVIGSAVACARGAQEGAVQEARPIASADGAAPRPQAPRRVPPTPMKLDTLRREAVAALMATLVGRENEPAGRILSQSLSRRRNSTTRGGPLSATRVKVRSDSIQQISPTVTTPDVVLSASGTLTESSSPSTAALSASSA